MNPDAIICVTGGGLLASNELIQRVNLLLEHGLDAVLVREPQLDSARLLSLCAKLRLSTDKHDAALIVHTQVDIAAAVGADGVHLAVKDAEVLPSIRNWVGSHDMLCSISCHSAEELELAHVNGADFALLSSVFPTESHPEQTALGIDEFNSLRQKSPIPVVALGGINASNRSLIKDCPVAAIRGLLLGDNVQQNMENMRH
ncbi:MAG: thiamine phosphate synthase [Mariprofundales bacterium]